MQVQPQAQGHKWFAAFWERVGSSRDAVRAEVAGGARGRVLEIGAGTGFNFPHYSPRVQQLVAIEPDTYMLRRAEAQARDLDIPMSLRRAKAENLPLADDSFNTVVSTLTLCSVDNPAQALSEIYRVLKPNGELRFYEHVRADSPALAFGQRLLTPFSRWLGAGCRQDRDTLRHIRNAGFEVRRLEQLSRTQVSGVAVPYK